MFYICNSFILCEKAVFTKTVVGIVVAVVVEAANRPADEAGRGEGNG